MPKKRFEEESKGKSAQKRGRDNNGIPFNIIVPVRYTINCYGDIDYNIDKMETDLNDTIYKLPERRNGEDND